MTKLKYGKSGRKKHLSNIPLRKYLTYAEKEEIRLWNMDRKKYRKNHLDKNK